MLYNLPNPIPYFSQDYFKKNREDLLNKIPSNSMVIIQGNQEIIRNKDVAYKFRQFSDFEHLTGFLEPNACLILTNFNSKKEYFLFVDEKDSVFELWNGKAYGRKEAVSLFGADEGLLIETFSDQLKELILLSDNVYFPFYQTSLENLIKSVSSDQSKELLEKIQDISPFLHEMRMIKSPLEIDMLTIACQISVMAHIKAMAMTKPGMMEYQIASILHQEFESYNGHWGYQSIVGSGKQACILHYIKNDQRVKNGDLILIDAGCEVNGFTGDITHTYPVSGVMNEAQLDVYTIVLEAMNQATAALIIGNNLNDYHQTAVRVLTQGLKDLKLLKGDLDHLIESGAYRRFYMHKTGHFLGRDVHDVGFYLDDSNDKNSYRKLQNNMVLTVEPGLYIPDQDDIPPQLRGIGVRLEDNVVVNDKTPMILTKDLPRNPQTIQEIMR